MNKYVIKRGIFSSLKTITLLLLVLIILFPFWQLIVSSLLETNAIISYPPKFWPKGGSVNNYVEVLTMQGGAYMRWMANSLLVSGANTILVILVAAMAGYAFAKLNFKGKGVLFSLVLIQMMLPSQIFIIPQYPDSPVFDCVKAGVGKHLQVADISGRGQRLRGLYDDPVYEGYPGFPFGSGNNRRVRRIREVF